MIDHQWEQYSHFLTSEVGHPTGVPLGINKQTGVPILFDNFHNSLTNYNMVIFAKSGAGKSVTMKTLISRSAVLMGIQSLALDAEGEYSIVAESLGGNKRSTFTNFKNKLST